MSHGKNIFFLCHSGSKPLNLFMKIRKKMYFETRSAHIYGVLVESPKFIYGDYLLPSQVNQQDFCISVCVTK